MLETIRQKASLKKLLLMAFFFLGVYIPLSSCVSGWQADVGITCMDFRFGGYGTEVVTQVLTTLGPEGRSIYTHLLALDCLMAFLYMSVLVLLNGWLMQKYLQGCRTCSRLLLCPMLAMLSDWTENLMTLCLIRRFPGVSPALVAVESVCTTLKFSLIGASALIAAAIFLYGLYKRYAKKGRR